MEYLDLYPNRAGRLDKLKLLQSYEEKNKVSYLFQISSVLV